MHNWCLQIVVEVFFFIIATTWFQVGAIYQDDEKQQGWLWDVLLQATEGAPNKQLKSPLGVTDPRVKSMTKKGDACIWSASWKIGGRKFGVEISWKVGGKKFVVEINSEIFSVTCSEISPHKNFFFFSCWALRSSLVLKETQDTSSGHCVHVQGFALKNSKSKNNNILGKKRRNVIELHGTRKEA